MFVCAPRWQTRTSRVSSVSSLPRPSNPTPRARPRLTAPARAHSPPILPCTLYPAHISHSNTTRQNAAFQPRPALLGSVRADLRVKHARAHHKSKHIPRPSVHIFTSIMHAPPLQLRHPLPGAVLASQHVLPLPVPSPLIKPSLYHFHSKQIHIPRLPVRVFIPIQHATALQLLH